MSRIVKIFGFFITENVDNIDGDCGLNKPASMIKTLIKISMYRFAMQDYIVTNFWELLS